MTERKPRAPRDGRRHAKRPRVFALLVLMVAALSALAVAGLEPRAKAAHISGESGQLL